MSMYRGQRIVRMLMAKEQRDNQLLRTDRSLWYHVDRSLLPVFMKETFHQFFFDNEAETFLEESFATSNSLCLQLYYTLVSTLLSFVMTKTSINGVLDRGGMFIFSTNQFREFLQIPADWPEKQKSLLDLGAGDGRVTTVMSQFFKNVSVTEASKVMEWRLRKRGFTVIPHDRWTSYGPFHLVSALNLLDRHFDPHSLLAELHSVTLRSNALLLIAVVLPLRQYVEFHPNGKTTYADSRINVEGETFEEQAKSLVEKVFEPSNFELVRWGRLPYLCEGDYNRAYYKLDDAIFLFRPKAAPTTRFSGRRSSDLLTQSSHAKEL